MASVTVGLLIGLERGWHERELPEGGRVAGLRTFALTGLLGGVLGDLFPAIWRVAVARGNVGHFRCCWRCLMRHIAKLSGNLSATSAVAMLLTLVLGTYAAARFRSPVSWCSRNSGGTSGHEADALHGWLRLIEHRELTAALQLLSSPVVILPNLPSVGMGPYKALNPYQLRWAVDTDLPACPWSGTWRCGSRGHSGASC
ncbi:MgtC/SapB family protein [Cupriavidus basilensis]